MAGRQAGPRTQLLVNGFAEFDVMLRHVRCAVAVLEEGQDPLNPSGMLFGLASSWQRATACNDVVITLPYSGLVRNKTCARHVNANPSTCGSSRRSAV